MVPMQHIRRALRFQVLGYNALESEDSLSEE
jgi:hypothetical protein